MKEEEEKKKENTCSFSVNNHAFIDQRDTIQSKTKLFQEEKERIVD